MADTENGADTGTPNPTPQVKMQILGQFIRDMSFENILSQKPVQGQVQPDIQVQVSIDAKKRTEPQYEVVTKFKITSKNKEGGETLFLMELDYGGVFSIEGVPAEQLHPFLLIECPRMLFPFVRRIVSDMTRDGGFPPLNLDNIDFIQLYRQTLAQRQAAAAEKPDETRVS
ncbi:protein-export chaperone SecB [Roseitranquillus sediminis]|uniref:protein-export chaperone SecB n=1 Tax=Roseitranquillus sediminis TaxID=2809051 RepID=UPI001D0C0361|nr:protein-export chaperone SecB [Roseitranquillus sediminis]MBM9596233.1 protein-export chaperone SecB [Roseitranquillus sediminis]